MKFNEPNYINLSAIPRVFVYFLIFEDEVVYVGKTTTGLARVYAHINSKLFNQIFVIECEEDNLDKIEAKYILKYNPMYNTNMNRNGMYSIRKSVRLINSRLRTKMTRPKLSKLLTSLGIQLVEFNGDLYIKPEDLDTICNHLVTNMGVKEKVYDEKFGAWI